MLPTFKARQSIPNVKSSGAGPSPPPSPPSKGERGCRARRARANDPGYFPAARNFTQTAAGTLTFTPLGVSRPRVRVDLEHDQRAGVLVGGEQAHCRSGRWRSCAASCPRCPGGRRRSAGRSARRSRRWRCCRGRGWSRRGTCPRGGPAPRPSMLFPSFSPAGSVGDRLHRRQRALLGVVGERGDASSPSR